MIVFVFWEIRQIVTGPIVAALETQQRINNVAIFPHKFAAIRSRLFRESLQSPKSGAIIHGQAIVNLTKARITRIGTAGSAGFWEWCPRSDSNRHASRRWILSPLRLPFHHSGVGCALPKPPVAVNYNRRAAKVSQSASLPDLTPVANHRARWAEVPCVKVCGITCRPALRASVSSPI